MSYCFIDTETTGLSLEHHSIWEIAYAFDDEPVRFSCVPHSLVGAEPKALEINNYRQRGENPGRGFWELELRERLEAEKPYLVGANPAFDAYRLSRRWAGSAPWRYRLIDVESIAIGVLGYRVPRGLADIAEDLRGRGHDIPWPDHSSPADVEATRAVFKALTGWSGEK